MPPPKSQPKLKIQSAYLASFEVFRRSTVFTPCAAKATTSRASFFVSKTNKVDDCKTQTIVRVVPHPRGREQPAAAITALSEMILRNNVPLQGVDSRSMAKRQRYGRPHHDIDLLVAILRFASVISRPMRDGVADPTGFSANELRILMALSGEGESAGHDLAELMGMHAMNVSRALSSLHTMGLVEPAKNSKNRRRKPYRISARGSAAYIALQPRIAQIADFLFGALTTAERGALEKILAKLDGQVMAWQPDVRRPHVPRA
jgi:DNA-binding MarR family transcriptional regulator